MAKVKSIAWTHGLISKTFALQKFEEGYPLLEDWVDVTNNLTEVEIEMLEKRRKKLLKNVNGWNEETLKMKFIAFILDMADYDVGQFQGIHRHGYSRNAARRAPCRRLTPARRHEYRQLAAACLSSRA